MTKHGTKRASSCAAGEQVDEVVPDEPRSLYRFSYLN
jgi:hypothetical protein